MLAMDRLVCMGLTAEGLATGFGFGIGIVVVMRMLRDGGGEVGEGRKRHVYGHVVALLYRMMKESKMAGRSNSEREADDIKNSSVTSELQRDDWASARNLFRDRTCTDIDVYLRHL
jgi:hypothetical protein